MNRSTTRKRFRIRRRSALERTPQPKAPPTPKTLQTPAVSLPTTDASVISGRRAGFAAWAAATIFVSAFLLFQVQPIISKMILPWFGGTPMVWTTCLLFFQTLLLLLAHVGLPYFLLSSTAPLEASVVDRPTWGRKLSWLILPALASMLLLAVTNHLCQDVAVIPFLWIVPLCLYLLSFILCFDSPRWYHRGVFGWVGGLVILTLSVFMLGEIPLLDQLGVDVELPELSWNLPLEAGLYFAVLFLVCMLCHGELVRRKPAPRHLTSFYFGLISKTHVVARSVSF